jgi:diaminopimelate epimerase
VKQLISFSKYSGCGNDFFLIDNRSKNFPLKDSYLIRKLCDRKGGIGADGVILLEHSHFGDFCMRIFNSDGSEAEMCGNGLRCFGRFLGELAIPGKTFNVEVMGRLFPVTIQSKNIRINMGPPQAAIYNQTLMIDSLSFSFDFLNTGVPHVVIFTNDLETIELDKIAPQIRYHFRFAPQGANVNFVSINTEGVVFIRTFERGVEQETLACGTGATAAAISANKKYGCRNPISVIPRSGEELLFTLVNAENILKDIIMEGPATFLFKDQMWIENVNN